MTKQEQINEMAEILEKAYVDARSNCGSLNQGFGMWYAKYLYNAGYSKDYISEERAREIGKEMFDKVRKETAREILTKIRKEFKKAGILLDFSIIAKQYGVEVEE